MSNVVLKCENLGIVFGGLAAVNDFDIEVHEREIAGLIGPNGAGKTTVFNLLTKVYEPTSGEIFLNGESTAKKTTVQLSKAGIARTFQNIRLFNKLTVAENVMTAMNQSMKYSLLEAVLRLPRYWKEEKAAREKALELLSIFDMQGMADVRAGSLPYGAQRRLEIVRALATEPSLLLLDEPAAGMNPAETAELIGGTDGEHRPHPRQVRHRHPADRTRHEPGHGHLRPDHRTEFRPGDRPRHARRDPEQPRRYRSLSGQA